MQEFKLEHTLFQFLKDIEDNNNRTWYMENKQRYNEVVYNPLCGMIQSMHSTIRSIDKEIVDLPKYSISRIYRDMRFAKNRSYMRDHVWISWKRRTNESVPEYYFMTSACEFQYGMGFYCAGPQTMAAYRNQIDANMENFLNIVKPILEQKRLTIDGERYKRKLPSPLPEDLDWLYNLKNIYVTYRSFHPQELEVPLIYEQMKDDFLLLKDFYNYLLYL